jgi:hypothetical protein
MGGLTMAMYSTTELFEFIGRVSTCWDNDFVKLELDTTSTIIDAPVSTLEITATYGGGKNHIFGYAVIAKNGKTIRTPMPDVTFENNGSEHLINEVFKFVQTGYLLQRLMDTMSITTPKGVQI